MNHLPEAWGRPRDDVYGAYDASYVQPNGPSQHTQQPVVTGTSVLAIKFAEGIVIAADNLASYGSLARFSDVKRLLPYNNTSIIGCGGDISDMEYISRLLQSLAINETQQSSTPHHALTAANLHSYLAKVLYKRRSDFNPLWNQLLVAGFDADGKPFLASADLLGTTFSAPALATGFGAHLAMPTLRGLVEGTDAEGREKWESLSREEAEKAIRDCLKVLWYRDARSAESFSIAVVTKQGVELREDERLEEQSWAFAEGVRGYGTQVN